MIEDMEESQLGLLHGCKLLNVINNQNVYCLIEANEVINLVLEYTVGVLNLKQMCRYIQDSLLWIQFLEPRTNSIYQMCLSNP